MKTRVLLLSRTWRLELFLFFLSVLFFLLSGLVFMSLERCSSPFSAMLLRHFISFLLFSYTALWFSWFSQRHFFLQRHCFFSAALSGGYLVSSA
ncbi:uncharacterized protein F5Z01DRAFT_664218 [Emericellopsis atlantica]|uniref:Uncharacterized protein n=1 Tax=Emericellopsis atlantica TaxID=2614577 RepID=A0A9P7ZGA5_9HYPO|nr:uncharacterized protein F5Z01DRAFT_664218 [Emericellopsis atlantica]KAG9251196.1 hypothetical protein F5Z01DRAFT_664218 [Emericellopsis atlantica]